MPKGSESQLTKLQKRRYNQSKGQCQTLTDVNDSNRKRNTKRRESNLAKLQKKIAIIKLRGKNVPQSYPILAYFQTNQNGQVLQQRSSRWVLETIQLTLSDAIHSGGLGKERFGKRWSERSTPGKPSKSKYILHIAINIVPTSHRTPNGMPDTKSSGLRDRQPWEWSKSTSRTKLQRRPCFPFKAYFRQKTYHP